MGNSRTLLFDPWVRFSRRTVWFVALALVGTAALPAQTATEYEAKAALLYNFIKFVRWPESAETARRDFVIAAPSGSAFGVSLKGLDGRRVRGRTVRLETYGDTQIPEACDVVIVDLDDWDDLSVSRRENLRARHVLTVSETTEFTLQGGVLSLFLVDDHLAFDINVDAARAAELEISANLLNLAHSRRNGGER